MMYCSDVDTGRLVCVRLCLQEAWLWTAICMEGGTFAFSAIRIKLAFSQMSYCTFKHTKAIKKLTILYDIGKKLYLIIIKLLVFFKY